MKRVLPAALPWLPLLAVAIAVGRYGSNIPYMDDWALLPLLDHYYQGTLGFSELLQPHNGHPLLISRSVMLLLAIATHWNILAQLVFTLCCAALNCLLLMRIAGHACGLPLRIALAIFTFSLAQAWNWIWGWQLQIPLCLFFVFSGFIALQQKNSPLAMCVAALCGICTSLSFGAGLLFWLAALPLVRAHGTRMTGCWLVLCITALAGYFTLLHGFPTDTGTPLLPVGLPPLGLTLFAGNVDVIATARIIALLLFNALASLGSLLARFSVTSAFIAGSGGLLCFLWLFLKNGRRAPGGSIVLALALFSLGAALMIAITRSFGGSEQMIASRYPTLMLPFWAAVLLQLRQTLQYRTVFWRLILTSLVLCNIANSVYSLQDFELAQRRFAHGIIALQDPHSEAGQKYLPAIGLSATEDFAVIDTLKKYRLSLFADSAEAR